MRPLLKPIFDRRHRTSIQCASGYDLLLPYVVDNNLSRGRLSAIRLQGSLSGGKSQRLVDLQMQFGMATGTMLAFDVKPSWLMGNLELIVAF